MSKNKELDPLEERMRLLGKGFKQTGNVYISGKQESGKKKKKKEKEKKLSTEGVYNLTLMNFQFHLYEIICEINGIDLDYYVATDSGTGQVQLANDLHLDDTFKRLSLLEWDRPESIDSLYFRGRFCTCLLYKLVRNSHKIIKSLYRAEYPEEDISPKKKYKRMHELLDQWIRVVDNFVTTYLAAKQNYLPSLLMIYELMTYEGNGSVSVLEYLRDTERLIRGGREPAAVEANNITKMAFVLATDSLKLGKCPQYRENFTYEDFNSAVEQVGGLGYAIMCRRRKDDSKLPMMYSAFQMANPKIISRFWKINAEAPEITVGLKALEFSKIFYGNSVRYYKLIDRIM